MRQEFINLILSQIKAPLNHPLFYPRLFALAVKARRQENQKSDTLVQLATDEFDDLSRRLDRSQIQDSCSVRNILRTRHLANVLIDEKGELNSAILPTLIQQIKNNLYSIGPLRQYDSKRQEHIVKVLQLLCSNKDIQRQLKKISRPFGNKIAEDAIRATLQLGQQTHLTDAHARKAALAAWLCYLRQNVGSCFATAPAIVVQSEQPELFLQDLSDLIATGSLKRVFAGNEYAAPISASWGSGDLKKPLFIQLSNQGINPELWHSPGLIKALESAGVLKAEDSIKEKTALLESWVVPLIKQKAFRSPFCFVTAEELLRDIMLHAMGLSEQQIKEYEERPRAMLQSNLLMQVSPSKKRNGGLGDKCADFLFSFEVAKNAFKSLTDNALLKTWEFTLASFSETKLEFTSWNLYASLGMGTNERGGIGECIQQNIQRKLDDVNQELRNSQPEYEAAFTQVKTLESRMRHSSTEKEVQWLKMEYQSRVNEFYFIEETRNELQHRSESLVNLYDTLYHLYIELFKNYFQEVYDADMQEVTTGPFDDSPAGFRLLYKHGRSNTSQWTRIKNQHDFIECLASFFVATEPEVASAMEKQGVEKDLSEVVTSIINHIKTREFLETAFYRMAAAHQVPIVKNPLENLEQVEKKPWVYTSGGTMNTLVSCYYRIEDKPKEAAKWVENEMELLIFLADSLKHVAKPQIYPFLEEKRKLMLMQSPTHAFILKPLICPFKDIWTGEEFTYTYVRDKYVKPAEEFLDRMHLDTDDIQYIVNGLMQKVPENFKPRFREVFAYLSGPMTPLFLRQLMVDALEEDRGLHIGRSSILSADEVDSYLFTHLPIFPLSELKERIYKLLILLPAITEEKASQAADLLDGISLSRSENRMGASQLQDCCKSLLCLYEGRTSFPYDYHLLVSKAAQQLGFSLPAPIIFADTNWVRHEFAFATNPGTGKLELWRVDYTGLYGHPMSNWKEWLNGSRPDLKWGVYIKPSEYGQSS